MVYKRVRGLDLRAEPPHTKIRIYQVLEGKQEVDSFATYAYSCSICLLEFNRQMRHVYAYLANESTQGVLSALKLKNNLKNSWQRGNKTAAKESGGGVLGLIFAEYVPLASRSPYLTL